jgi:Protein of unknown function (DUF1580)
MTCAPPDRCPERVGCARRKANESCLRNIKKASMARGLRRSPVIDLSTETPIPLGKAIGHRLFRGIARNGRSLSFSTLFRWQEHGYHGVKLETCRVGRALCTSSEAIERFIERLSEPVARSAVVTRAQAHRAHQSAERQLRAAGI